MRSAVVVGLVVVWAAARGTRASGWSGPGARRRRGPGPAPPALDEAVLLDLAAAALDAGASVPGAVDALGACLAGPPGPGLRRAAAVLVLGGSWSEAWVGTGRSCRVLADALEPAWTAGIPAGPLLARAADEVRARRARAAREAAARLGVRLALPLGLCLLPAFALLGLAPALLSTGAVLAGLRW